MYNCKTISPICVHPYNIIDLFYSNKQFRDLTSNLSEKRSNKPSNKQRQKPKLIGGFAEGFFPDPLIIVTRTMARRHFDCWTWKLDNNIRGGGFEDFLCSPLPGEMIQFEYFSKGLKPPTTVFCTSKNERMSRQHLAHLSTIFFPELPVAADHWNLRGTPSSTTLIRPYYGMMVSFIIP